MAVNPPPLPNNLTLQTYKRKTKSYTEDLGDGVKLTLMLMPAGQFLMGASKDEPESGDSERPQQEVTVPQFLMGRYPVTQAQWQMVAGYKQIDTRLEPDPLEFKGANRPVEKVNWSEAVEFCKRLSAHSGKQYRLPSEAEWEYACRADTKTPFHFGETITADLANYSGNSTYNGGPKGEYRATTTDVGKFPANDWGLHDMYGNVWEWCEDVGHSNYEGAPTDGSAWTKGGSQDRRVRRGGSWAYDPRYCRSAYRSNLDPRDRHSTLGFRVVCSAPRTLE